MDPMRHPVISCSKLTKGDAALSTTKWIFGWDIDTHKMILSLPIHRLTALHNLLTHFLAIKRTSRKRWRHLLGILHSTMLALYGAKHLFSILQYALTDTTTVCIRITPLLKQVLQTWLYFAEHIHTTLAPLHTLIPTPFTVVSTTATSLQGMGGFFSTLHPTPQNSIWRTPLPPHIQNTVVTHSNPHSTLNNSALELDAVISGTVLATSSMAPSHNLLTATNNIPAHSWITKGSTTSVATPAYLLHHPAQLCRQHAFSLSTCYTPGITNQLADCCSRLFNLLDDTFLQQMNAHFPVQPFWMLVTPPNNLLCSMNLALSNKFPSLASMQGEALPTIVPGTSGRISAQTFTATPSLRP
jgi:hypothetical protein